MDPVVVLRDTLLQVRPGDTARTTATVRNAGDLVEQYGLEILGPAAAWAEIIPASISVVRNGETTVQILFRPPAGPGTPAGSVPFALRCVSRENPDRVAIAEGDLAVGAIHEIVASLTPAVSRGRWKGRWTASFHNRGTAPARLRLEASDERHTLGFALAPTELTIEPGATGRAYLRARVARPTLLGALARHRVRLTYTRATGPDERIAEGFVDVSFEQPPVLSRATATLAGLALAGGVAAVVRLSRSTPRDDTAPLDAAPPPAPTSFSADTGGSGGIRLGWASVPGAKSYGIDRLVDDSDTAAVEGSKPAEGRFNALEWDGLPPGEKVCFRLVALNDAGASQPSPRACGTVGAAAATETPTPTPTATGPGGSGTGTESPTPSPTPTGTATAAPPGTEPKDVYIVLGLFPKNDQSGQNAQVPARRQAELDAALQADTVLVADSDTSTRLSAHYHGSTVIYLDKFISAEDAQQYCDDNTEALGPNALCVVRAD
jgi:hypothetical protein